MVSIDKNGKVIFSTYFSENELPTLYRSFVRVINEAVGNSDRSGCDVSAIQYVCSFLEDALPDEGEMKLLPATERQPHAASDSVSAHANQQLKKITQLLKDDTA